MQNIIASGSEGNYNLLVLVYSESMYDRLCTTQPHYSSFLNAIRLILTSLNEYFILLFS